MAQQQIPVDHFDGGKNIGFGHDSDSNVGHLAEILEQLRQDGILGLKKAVVEVTNAQLLALQSAAVELVAAPGAGWYNHIEQVLLDYEYGSAAFVKATGGELAFNHEGGFAFNQQAFVGLLDATSNQKRLVLLDATGVPPAPVNITLPEDEAFELVNNGGGEWTTGVGNTLKIAVFYRTLPTEHSA